MNWEKTKKWLEIAVKSGFWFWNGTLLITVGFGFLPLIATEIFSSAASIPGDYLFFTTVIMLLGPFSMLFAYRYCKSASAIMRFFYGVEAPIFFLSIARIFLLRELTPATTHLAVAIAIALIAFTLEMRKSIAVTGSAMKIVRQGALTFGLFVALYFGSLLLFYMPPTIFYTLKGIGSVASNFLAVLQTGQIFAIGLYFLIYGGFIFVTGLAAFAVFPLFLIYYYGQSFLRGWRANSTRTGRAVSIGLLIANFLMFWLLSFQPQEQTRKLDPDNLGEADIAWILANENAVKLGIMNSYLAPYRYLGVAESKGHIEELYKSMLGETAQIAEQLQHVYNFVASPFLYTGKSIAEDQDKASRLYEKIFDKPIQKGETSNVNRAINANYNRDQAEASLLDEDNEDVLLTKQEIQIAEKGAYAEVEIYEVYENQTAENKEILYYFSLPKTAAITGVWLAQDGDREKLFSYTVAPRGAAQQVYTDEVRRRVDPALLEQVGPQSYRLRVFPIEGRRLGSETRKTHLWISYVALPAVDQTWPTPTLLEKRNVYWDESTIRQLNKQTVSIDHGQWLPKITRSQGGFTSLSAEVEPGVFVSVRKQQPSLRRSARVAILIDTSGSMREDKDAVFQSLNLLHNQLAQYDASVSYFFTGMAEAIGVERIPNSLSFFGNQPRDEILSWFAAQTKDEAFDAVLFVTDSDTDPNSAAADRLLLPGPTWMLFVDGRHVSYLDDELMRSVLRSGGGAVVNAQEAVLRALASDDASSYGQSVADVVGFEGDYLWTVSAERPKNLGRTGNRGGFERLAAAWFIHYKAQTVDVKSPKSLHIMHKVAQDFGVVSPWSSMIVLVNERQREALAAAVAKADAFERENETGKQLLNAPPNDFATVPGTPEPEEWALIVAVLAFGLYEMRRRGLLGDARRASRWA